MGTPVLWWIGVFALAAAIVLWLLNRDWRFAVPVVGLFAAWLPWFPNSERPVFFFYAIMMIPFTCIAIALCLGALIGRPGGPRRVAGAITAGGVVLALVMLNFASFTRSSPTSCSPIRSGGCGCGSHPGSDPLGWQMRID